MSSHPQSIGTLLTTSNRSELLSAVPEEGHRLLELSRLTRLALLELGSSVELELYHAEQQALPGPVNPKDEEETVFPEGSESFGEEAEDEGLLHEERCQVRSFSQELASRAMMPAAAFHMFTEGPL